MFEKPCLILTAKEAHAVKYYEGTRKRYVEVIWEQAGMRWTKDKVCLCGTPQCKEPTHWRLLPPTDLSASSINSFFSSPVGVVAKTVISAATEPLGFKQILTNAVMQVPDVMDLSISFKIPYKEATQYTEYNSATAIQDLILNLIEQATSATLLFTQIQNAVKRGVDKWRNLRARQLVEDLPKEILILIPTIKDVGRRKVADVIARYLCYPDLLESKIQRLQKVTKEIEEICLSNI